MEILVFLLAGALLVFLATRKRVDPLMVVLLVIVLSPFVAMGLAFFTGAILDVFAPA
ncbi:hypothetical protein [Rubrobacter tropicus]|uniref:hypothetical protein n=1 Tax=Rubrobacter tropicus TaxID=2653851 RepID=UPI00140B65CB|nr:hypothetical protein [Rubrobacter tropicus]